MNVIAVFFIGLASGWVLEFLFDWWFWGRRNRSLAAQLDTCRLNVRASQKKAVEAQAMVAQHLEKEDECRKCQYDLIDQIDKQNHLERISEKLSSELKASRQRIGRLNRQITELRAERDHLGDTLETVNQWVETSMRRRVWDTASWQDRIRRSSRRPVAYTRSLAATAASPIARAAEQFSGGVSSVKMQFGRGRHLSWPGRLLNRGYCALRELVGMVNKKAPLPGSCSIRGK
ncbi:hypothetical protein DSCA_55890 [Desulfosarcina alkanivorans]|uniref:Uncharacterized protein n=1 Tax=Desulfosarcina alkanivorans TaxID=571177 RepID=A0A5K7YUG4_9BACT|nr:hypothetical protein [Desulfosarcina alkanivorans]BBO71659.1 hypothetical protein DSCA_55890 [Desulfosarcina alkanivorans]